MLTSIVFLYMVSGIQLIISLIYIFTIMITKILLLACNDWSFWVALALVLAISFMDLVYGCNWFTTLYYPNAPRAQLTGKVLLVALFIFCAMPLFYSETITTQDWGALWLRFMILLLVSVAFKLLIMGCVAVFWMFVFWCIKRSI